MVQILRGLKREDARPARFEQTTILPFHRNFFDCEHPHLRTRRQLSPALMTEIEKGPIGFGVKAFKSRPKRIRAKTEWGHDNSVLADLNYLSFDSEKEFLDGVLIGDVKKPLLRNFPLLFFIP